MEAIDGSVTVRTGTAFEWNGLLWVMDADLTVPVSGSELICSIYFNGSALALSSAKPTWNPLKRGWYSGTSRALAKFFYHGGKYLSKTVLEGVQPRGFDTFVSVGAINTAGATQVDVDTALRAGLYAFQLQAGNGGNGGTGAQPSVLS